MCRHYIFPTYSCTHGFLAECQGFCPLDLFACSSFYEPQEAVLICLKPMTVDCLNCVCWAHRENNQLDLFIDSGIKSFQILSYFFMSIQLWKTHVSFKKKGGFRPSVPCGSPQFLNFNLNKSARYLFNEQDFIPNLHYWQNQ